MGKINYRGRKSTVHPKELNLTLPIKKVHLLAKFTASKVNFSGIKKKRCIFFFYECTNFNNTAEACTNTSGELVEAVGSQVSEFCFCLCSGFLMFWNPITPPSLAWKKKSVDLAFASKISETS